MTSIQTDPSSQIESSLSDKDQQAISLFEQAIVKESHGSMSDAIDLYRKAFKINDKIDSLYRHTQLPGKIQQLRDSHGENSLAKLDEAKIKAIDVPKLLKSFEHEDAKPPSPEDQDGITIKFANLGLDNHEKVVMKPVSPLIHLPNDIWVHILEILLIAAPESWIQLSVTCKKFAYLGLSTNDIWRKLCYLVYPKQNYEENQDYINSRDLPVPLDQLKIVPSYNNNWKRMLEERPFVKFGGVYISVVNYYSEGGKAEFSSSWLNPVRTVTYYRYLRFYPDGSCVKVLTALEPYKVVPHLLKLNHLKNITSALEQARVHAHHSSVKEGHRIYHGTWTMTTTGEVHVVIDEGSVPYYTFHYIFQIKSLSKIFKYNKLNWTRCYTVRKKMSDNDDREGEISDILLRNEKAFKFLRVKSYHHDN